MLTVHLPQGVFKRRQIHRLSLGRAEQNIGNRGGNISVQQRQHLLHDRQHHANRAHGPHESQKECQFGG